MNSYWMFWIGCLRGARSELARWAVSAIYENWPFVIYSRSLLYDTRKSCVFQIFLLRNIKAYLCPNIIYFDAVDFSERRPEEVISFFWRSVYYQLHLPVQRVILSLWWRLVISHFVSPLLPKSEICSKFYWWVSKIACHSPIPHCCLGKLPL